MQLPRPKEMMTCFKCQYLADRWEFEIFEQNCTGASITRVLNAAGSFFVFFLKNCGAQKNSYVEKDGLYSALVD